MELKMTPPDEGSDHSDPDVAEEPEPPSLPDLTGKPPRDRPYNQVANEMIHSIRHLHPLRSVMTLGVSLSQVFLVHSLQ